MKNKYLFSLISCVAIALFLGYIVFFSKQEEQLLPEYAQTSYAFKPSICGTARSLKFEDLPDAKLLPGIGNSSWKITTSSDSAQVYFNQGLNALHAFWDVEAFKAFKKGLKFDALSPMLHWGLSQSITQTAGELKDLKRKSMQNAVEYSNSADNYEKDFILANYELSANGGKAYTSAMEAYISKYPDQIEAKLLYARFLSVSVRNYSTKGVPTANNVKGQDILKRILEQYPKSAAAHHYWIHAVENSPEPQIALKSAAIIPVLAPSSGHMTHMPGHIYYRTGNYDQANVSFYNSLKTDSLYMSKFKMDAINNWNYTHNMDYLVASCAENGQYKKGLQWAKRLSNINLDRSRLMSGGSGYILFGAYTSIPRFYMRFEAWNNAAESIDTLIHKIPWNQSSAVKYFEGMRHYAKGMHHIVINKPAQAAMHLKKLNEITEHLLNNRSSIAADWYYRYAVKILAVNAQELEALINYRNGNVSTAIAQLHTAAESEKEIGYWEPPHYTRPVYESLAWVYSREKKSDEAMATYNKALKIRPKNGHTQFALAKTLEDHNYNTLLTVKAYKEFLIFWKNADNFKNKITHANNYIKKHD